MKNKFLFFSVVYFVLGAIYSAGFGYFTRTVMVKTEEGRKENKILNLVHAEIHGDEVKICVNILTAKGDEGVFSFSIPRLDNGKSYVDMNRWASPSGEGKHSWVVPMKSVAKGCGFDQGDKYEEVGSVALSYYDLLDEDEIANSIEKEGDAYGVFELVPTYDGVEATGKVLASVTRSSGKISDVFVFSLGDTYIKGEWYWYFIFPFSFLLDVLTFPVQACLVFSHLKYH